MPEDREDKAEAPPFGRLPRFGDLLEVSDEMIAFVEKYQQVWQNESRAMLALGEFLGARADSLRAQVELMRMGSDAFRRYTSWSDAILGLRPEAFVQAWLRSLERFRNPEKSDEE